MTKQPQPSRRSPGRSGGASFGRLTKKDLRAFDELATELILEAIELGCQGRVSRRGHCLLRNADGETTAIARNLTSANRAAQNARAQIRRLTATQNNAPTETKK